MKRRAPPIDRNPHGKKQPQMASYRAGFGFRPPAGAANSGIPVPSSNNNQREHEEKPKASAQPQSNDHLNKENDHPSATSKLHDAIFEAFSDDRMSSIESELRFRPKANKFNAKAKQEEQVAYIKRLKSTLKSLVEQIQHVCQLAASAKETGDEHAASIHRRLQSLEKSLKDKEKALSSTQEAYNHLETTKASLETQIQSLEDDLASMKDEAKKTSLQHDNLTSQVESLETDKRGLEETLRTTRSELLSTKASLESQVQTQERMKHEMEEWYEKKQKSQVESHRQELQDIQTQLSQSKEQCVLIRSERDIYQAKVSTLETQLQDIMQTKDELQRQVHASSTAQASATSQMDEMKGEIQRLKDDLHAKDLQVSKQTSALGEMERSAASASSSFDRERQELKTALQELQQERKHDERDLSFTKHALQETQRQLDVSREEGDKLRQREESMREQVRQAETQAQEASREYSVAEGVRQMLERQAKELRTEVVAVTAQMEAVKSELRAWQTKAQTKEEEHEKEMEEVKRSYEAKREEMQTQMAQVQEEKAVLESEVGGRIQEESLQRDEEAEELHHVRQENERLKRRLQDVSRQQTDVVQSKQVELEELRRKVVEGETLRRKLHNQIQELRGNVRVFVRTRPFLPSDTKDDGEAVVCEGDGQSVALSRPDKDVDRFTFDKVFAPSDGQEEVFEQVQELVQSSLDGYHVCLFSYGQTGSGKTHTMQGSGRGGMRGLIPRAIEKVLLDSKMLQEEGWTYRIRVSFLEIYNENLRDLLASDDKKLSIKKDKNKVFVPDLSAVQVTDMDAVEKLMERASRARSVASTDMNSQSSRSHSVFTLHLTGVKASDGVTLDGQLNLVDLAGSERASRSNVSGERLKETQAINKSLSCLADVFSAIGNKSSHIPFRNSKLTYLLQNCLSGDGKTLMMVNLSPTAASVGESLCSLRFAKQVNQCELGKPKRQIQARRDDKQRV